MQPEETVDLFLDHTHTDRSNEYMDELQDVDELTANNHRIDYLAIRDKVPEDINVIFNRTEHHATDTDFYDELREEVEELGGEFKEFERHVYWELDGKEAAIINSVEASVEDKDTHILLNGLPINDGEYYELSEDKLYQEAQEAEWIAPAHSFLPYSNFYDRLDEFLGQAAEDDGIRPALGYTTGYSPTWNLLARGEIQKYVPDFVYDGLSTIAGLFSDEWEELIADQKHIERSVYDVQEEAEERGIPLPFVPELDLHVVVPDRLEGTAVLEETAMDDLKDGELPTGKLLDTKVLRYSPLLEGMTFRDQAHTIPDRIPGYDKEMWPSLPRTEQEFKGIFESSLEGLEEMNVEEIRENTYDPRVQEIQQESSYTSLLFDKYTTGIKNLIVSIGSIF